MKKKTKKKNFTIKPILVILILFTIFASIFMLYSLSLFTGIETPLRICISILLVDIIGITMTIGYKCWKKQNKKGILFLVILFLYSSILTYGSYRLKKLYTPFSNLSSTTESIHSSSIVVRKDSDIEDIDGAKKVVIGLLEEEGNTEAYEIPMQIISEENFDTEKIVTYTDHVSLIQDLLSGEIDAAFLPTNYTIMYASEEFESLADDTKIIYTKQTTITTEEETTTQKSLDEPFTVLIMGVDTTGDGIGSSFNGDALLLLTFNPKTLNTTILSIPRDSYMPISCMSNRKNKITNAGWQGESCIINSLENYFDIEIDYYYKINFKGVVSLIDAIGGIDVEVPYSFCEQDSQRRWGTNTVFVKSGQQHLDGEQALAFARHRKTTAYMRNYCGSEYTENSSYWNDFVRGQNQQVILKAILNKLADVKSFSTIEELLNTISNNAKTNMSTDTILSAYNLAKSIVSNSNGKNQMLNMQRLYLSGYDSYIYDYSFLHSRGTKLTTYNYIIYDDSYDAVVKAMKINLGLEEATVVKTFSFSITQEYEQTIIGKGVYSAKTLVQMKNFVGTDISTLRTFAYENNLNIVINEVEGTSSQSIGEITSQSIPELTDLSMLDSSRTVTVSVVTSVPSSSSTIPEIPDDTTDIDEDTNIEIDDDLTE